ncbi:MAG: Smr/MutS family protein [Candidatus Porifericomitaceae bacterium WSBS_2022_MAG_OTU9]
MHSRDSELFRELVGTEIKPIKKIKTAAKPLQKVPTAERLEKVHIAAKSPKRVLAAKPQSKATASEKKAAAGISYGTDNSKKYRIIGVPEQQFKTWERHVRKQQDYPGIDLHGYTQKDAKQQIAQFITTLKHNKTSTGSVIHGKGLRSRQGEAVLRQLLRRMLEQDPAVKGYLTTSSGGATLIWLKT